MARFVDVKLGDFQLDNVEAPETWSDRAVQIAARLYFAPGETSIYKLVHRVVAGIVGAPAGGEFFGNAARLQDILLKQRAAFNTPVWMNVGVKDRDQQAWACLILGVDDSMESIEAGWNVESRTFQLGSGSGVNVSRIRANGEPLRDGAGVGSGPISLWMRPTDSIAGVVRSGGRTRRAAKMVIMDVDHPEVLDFIEVKARAERMARLLQEQGFDIAMNGKDSSFVPYQNANHSVRATHDWMRRVQDDQSFDTRWRLTGASAQTLSAREVFDKLCKAAWECGDPGMQFHDTVNEMNPVKDTELIRGSNPCSEYMFVDNTVCNLASINLMSYLVDEQGSPDFDVESFMQDVRVMVWAMDKLVDVSSYPTPLIAETTKRYRTLGLGFANLGALLMSLGIAYDSAQGRHLAAQLMSLLQVTAVRTSQQLAQEEGAYPAWQENNASQAIVITKHREAGLLRTDYGDLLGVLEAIAREYWMALDPSLPLRNAQLSVIAPTGTISFLMDCETTGIEPVLALKAEKTLVGGGTLDVGVLDCVQRGVRALRHRQVLEPYMEDEDFINAFPSVFQTALDEENFVRPEAHVLMMAAVQPFVSGAISKTVNLPTEATVEDVKSIYKLAWETGCKAIAVYRNGCKAFQPVVPIGEEKPLVQQLAPEPHRRRPAGTRAGLTHKFMLGGDEFYLTANFYKDGKLCEAFIRNNKHGSAIAGWVDVASIAISLGLQYGVPFKDYLRHFRHMAFEPSGMVQSDSSIKMASSPVDYIVRWLDARSSFNEEQAAQHGLELAPLELNGHEDVTDKNGRPCSYCGSPKTRWAGSCVVCEDCGETSGCS